MDPLEVEKTFLCLISKPFMTGFVRGKVASAFRSTGLIISSKIQMVMSNLKFVKENYGGVDVKMPVERILVHSIDHL